jgi:hypothetical protein
MQVHPHRFAVCTHAGTDHTIWLPHSSLLGTDVSPPSLRDDTNPQIFACPTCGHAADYNRRNYQSHLLPHADQYLQGVLRLATVEFPCGIENCEARVRIHTPVETGKPNAQITERARMWTLDIHCSKGHWLKQMPQTFEVGYYTY